MFPNAMNHTQMNPGMGTMVPQGMGTMAPQGMGNSALLGASYPPNQMMQGVPNASAQMTRMGMNPMMGNNPTPFGSGVNTQNRQYGMAMNYPNNGQFGNTNFPNNAPYGINSMLQQPWGPQNQMPANDNSHGLNTQSRNNREPAGRAPSIITSRRNSISSPQMPSDHEIGTAIAILKRAEKSGAAKMSERRKEVSFDDEVTTFGGNQNYPSPQAHTWNQGNSQQNIPNTNSRQNYYVY